MNAILIELCILLFTIFLFFIIYCIFAWNTNNWNGIENEDNSILDKLVNRLYFTLSTTTTIGYGNMSAKTKKCKLLVIIQMFVVTFEVLTAVLHK